MITLLFVVGLEKFVTYTNEFTETAGPSSSEKAARLPTPKFALHCNSFAMWRSYMKHFETVCRVVVVILLINTSRQRKLGVATFKENIICWYIQKYIATRGVL